MALGDTYNNNEKRNYSPSVNSGYRFNNAESTIDKTSLTFTFWNKFLKVSIAPKKETEGDIVQFDYDNAGSVYLSHTKARILHDEMIYFLEQYRQGTLEQKNVGVSSGAEGLIYICDGTEFSANGPCLVIRKIDQDGNCTSTFVYEFKRDTYTSVMNYAEKNKSFDTHKHEYIEIEQMITLLNDYYTNMTMATAYSIQEAGKFDTSRMNTKMKIIGEKLGVEWGKNNNENKRSSNNSYFNNAKPSTESNDYGGGLGNTSYRTGSIDDMD